MTQALRSPDIQAPLREKQAPAASFGLKQARNDAVLREQPKKPGEISLDGVSVRFGKDAAPAVSGISLDIASGEFIALLGPSGCGKSTLLNVIGGMLAPTQGKVTLDGDEVTGPHPDFNVVFQQHSLFAWMTVLENVAFGPRSLGWDEPEETARKLLRLVGLERFAHAYPSTLSGGMQQRVAIARALATFPKVLLMDEPFGALDAQTRSIMQEELLKLRNSFSPTVVFVTHDVDEALLLADRIIIMGVNPGTVKDDISVGVLLPEAGKRELDVQFIRLRGQILAQIREETRKVFHQ